MSWIHWTAPQLFVDLDGVLGDYRGHYAATFGERLPFGHGMEST